MEPRYDHSNVSANTRRCMFDQTTSRNPRFSRHEILIRGNAARGEKNSKKICLSEIIFLVALSRSGWNFNNHFVDFPGEPLERAAFAKKKKEEEGKRKTRKEATVPYRLFPGSRCAALPFWYQRRKNCEWIFHRCSHRCFMLQTCLF